MTTTAVGFVGDVDKIPWSEMASLHSFEASSGLTVTAAAGTRNVSVATGSYWIAGILFKVTAAETVTFGANASGNPRLDRLVARANWGTNGCTLVVVPGTPGASPSPPTLTRTAGDVWEAPIARVLIANGATTINSGDITQESVPRQSGFRRIASIATAPDPAANFGLIYYTPSKSLRAAEGGVYVEVAHARGQMVPVFDESTSQALVTNTTPDDSAGSPTLPVVGVTFVAPDSGKVYITVGGYITATQDSQSTWLSWELRTGGTIGSGSVVLAPILDRAIITSSAVNPGSPALFGGSLRYPVLSGLTPGSTYNVRCMHAVGGLTGQVNNRSILVEPVIL